MRAALLTLLLLGCNSREAPKDPPAKVVTASKTVREQIADTIVASIAANDFSRLRPMFKTDPEDKHPLSNLYADSIPSVRTKLATWNIDPATLKLVRIHDGKGAMESGVHLIDVFVEGNGKLYKTHFSVTSDGRENYQLLGIADWIVPADDVSKN